MKVLIISAILLSSSAFAQNIDLNGLKSLLTQRQSSLENVYQGMAKKLTTQSVAEIESFKCRFTQTQIQTVLKIENDNMIIHSKENFVPEASPDCKAANFEAFESNIVFFEELPKLSSILTGLDESKDQIKSLSKSGEIVTMTSLDENLGLVTSSIDLSKSSFKNIVSVSAQDFSLQLQDIADIDVYSIDLTNVLFCGSSDGEEGDCVEGDFSDILF